MADPSSDGPSESDEEGPIQPMNPAATEVFGSQPQPNFIQMSASVFDAFLSLNRLQKPKLVENPMEDFLNPSWMQTASLFVPPRIGMVASVVTPNMTSPAAVDHTHWSKLAAQRLRHSSLVKTDDQIRWQALRKIKTIVLFDPMASKLGRTLMNGVKMFTTESEWEASFADAFQGKSTATLAKRAGALWRYSEWAVSNNLPSILMSTESMVYKYMEYLKQHGSPTTATSFLQAWTFLHHSIGMLQGPLDDILSSRVRGAARFCMSMKRPLQQAHPLSAKMIVALENVVKFAPYDHWRIIAGHMLMCLGSCSRFGDTIHLTKLEISSHEGLQLIEAESSSYKTAQTEERRLKLLPVLSLGRFFVKGAWAMDWLHLREKHGLKLDPSLPAFSEISKQWLERRMTTGEAALYLQEFLTASGFPADQLEHIGCHSLKTTLLSWAAKGNYLGVPDRLVMGHHMSRENQSAVAYARDELTRIQVVIHQMLQDVKNQTFKPDASRAERLFKAIAAEVSEAEDQSTSSDSDAEVDEVRLPHFAKQDRPGWDDMPLDLLARLKMHVFSGVVHVTTEANPRVFHCGRSNTKNFKDVTSFSNCCDMPICMQCRPAGKSLT